MAPIPKKDSKWHGRDGRKKTITGSHDGAAVSRRHRNKKLPAPPPRPEQPPLVLFAQDDCNAPRAMTYQEWMDWQEQANEQS